VKRALAVTILCAAMPTGVAAALQSPSEERPIQVFLDKPDRMSPAFGSVEMVASVASEEPVTRVVFYVDGIVAAELSEPPYSASVEVGTENRRHRFEAVAYTVSGATARASFTTPRIRVDEEVTISLQQLYVTVTRDGQRITDLTQEEFTVLDEGRRQKLVTFARGDIPFTAALLLDSSTSMAGDKLRAALAGAKAFFERMSPLDEGRLIVFSDRILHSSPFTSYPEVLSAGLDGVQAAGGTALADHLYLALKQLQERQGRRVVILLSDGVDSHSVLSMADALGQARRSQALIYWLRLPYGSGSTGGSGLPRLASAWRSSADYDREFALLAQTVLESGGRIAPLNSMSEIGPAFEEIRQELREQYVLGYYPTGKRRDGRWRKVKVRLRDPSLEVRARDGYNDF
jgi:Ca-activated chloride channel family protein